MTISDLADERLRRKIERLREALHAKQKTLPREVRPTMARNLGSLVEDLWPLESHTKIVARVLESAFSADGAHSKIRNRRRYVRLASDPLPTSEVDVGEYAAKVSDFWPIAEAIAREQGGGNERRWTILSRMVAGTSFGEPASTAPLSSAAPDHQVQSELAAVAGRIGALAGVEEYFAALSSSPTDLREVEHVASPTDVPFEPARYSPEQLARWKQPANAQRFTPGDIRCDFASLQDHWEVSRGANWQSVPAIFIGWAYIPFPVLSVDLPEFGHYRRAEQLTEKAWAVEATRIWEAIRARFSRGPGARGFDDDDCGGEPVEDDPWSLLSHNWESREWEMNDLSNFWASPTVEDNVPPNLGGRAWRRLYAKGAIWLSLVPTSDGLRFGLGGGPEPEGFHHHVAEVAEANECSAFSVELPTGDDVEHRSARKASFFWRGGLYLYRWCPSDTFDVYEKRMGVWAAVLSRMRKYCA